ncbi:MAG: methyltransferase domain-containing protein [Phycisphaerae bacterium]|nr:protein N-lysine methyltransferase family protein [Phycisphaerae bacterium]NUQ47236.1 methyltransferase domain-containing protein [Phycisphaerae bacterium]
MSPPQPIRGHPVRTYPINVAGRTLRLLGPADPDALLDDPRTETRFYAEDEHMPYWACPWAASVMLAHELAAGGVQLPANRAQPPTALEIGCGLGLAGLAAAMLGWRVTLTDYEEDALEFARASAALNELNDVEFRRLDWRGAAPVGTFDLILAADVLFERRWVEPVAAFVAANIGEGAALVSDPNRRTADGFEAALRMLGLHVAIRATRADDPDGTIVDGRIYRIAAIPDPNRDRQGATRNA